MYARHHFKYSEPIFIDKWIFSTVISCTSEADTSQNNKHNFWVVWDLRKWWKCWQCQFLWSFPSDKGPSLRQLNSKSPELELPLLQQNGDNRADSATDDYNDEDEEQEITHHWSQVLDKYFFIPLHFQLQSGGLNSDVKALEHMFRTHCHKKRKPPLQCFSSTDQARPEPHYQLYINCGLDTSYDLLP